MGRQLHRDRSFSGVPPYSPDTLPILGEVEELQGFVTACGFGDKGIGLGVASARLVARSIIDRAAGISEVLSPRRFSKKERGDNSCLHAGSKKYKVKKEAYLEKKRIKGKHLQNLLIGVGSPITHE